MKLYYSPGACALSPQIVLREAGLPFTLVKTNLKDKTTEDGGDFWAVNAKGSVPALQLENGAVLTEGPAIVQYVADLAPAANLAPANGTFERVRLQEMLNYITSELHKGIGSLFNSAMPESFRPVVKETVLKKLAYVDAILAKTPYLMGANFTVADAYLYNVVRWTAYDSIGIDTSKLTNLTTFMERMTARPSVQAALKAEGLI